MIFLIIRLFIILRLDIPTIIITLIPKSINLQNTQISILHPIKLSQMNSRMFKSIDGLLGNGNIILNIYILNPVSGYLLAISLW